VPFPDDRFQQKAFVQLGVARLVGKRKIVAQLKRNIVFESLASASSIYEVGLRLHEDSKVNQTAIALEVMYFLLHSLNRQTTRKDGSKALQAALFDPVASRVVEAFARILAALKDDPKDRIAAAISDVLYLRELEYCKIPELLGSLHEGLTGHNSVEFQTVVRISTDCGFPRDAIFQAATENSILESLRRLQFPENARAMETLRGPPPN
jgi:hypothetical protein